MMLWIIMDKIFHLRVHFPVMRLGSFIVEVCFFLFLLGCMFIIIVVYMYVTINKHENKNKNMVYCT